MTAVILYIYAYGLTKRAQLVVITVFLVAKPVFSVLAVFLSGYASMALYMAAAGIILASVAACSFFLTKLDLSAERSELSADKIPPRVLFAIFALFTLIVFERMNGAFTLSVNRTDSALCYLMYFSGCLIAAVSSWWLFVRKGRSVLYAYFVFLTAAILHFVFRSPRRTASSFSGASIWFFSASQRSFTSICSSPQQRSASPGGPGDLYRLHRRFRPGALRRVRAVWPFVHTV
jgi:hypothetical protein